MNALQYEGNNLDKTSVGLVLNHIGSSQAQRAIVKQSTHATSLHVNAIFGVLPDSGEMLTLLFLIELLAK
jgi:hypothetical protein